MYIDAHTHLDKYEADAPEILAEIETNRIFTVSVSMDPDAYASSRKLEARSPLVLSTFGIHPWNAPKHHADLASFDSLIASSPMIGEIGLDYHFITEPDQHETQRDVFRHFVQKGVAQDKILNIHSKGAEADVDAVLGHLNARRAILHWYSGPFEVLKKLSEKGYYFSVGVEMLFDPHIQAIAQAVPAVQLLTETDNPGGYHWLTGVIGRPALIKSVIGKLAALRQWRPEQTQETIFENFMRLAGNDARAYNLRVGPSRSKSENPEHPPFY
jgi:TatD DNase family protein